MDQFNEWDQILESEGLGVIDTEHDTRMRDRRKLSKHQRLDAEINGIECDADGFMTLQPYTADASEVRQTFSWQVNAIVEIDGSGDDTMMDCLALSMLATEKEAEMANRRLATGSVDSYGRKRSRKNLSRSQRVENLRARQRGEPEPFTRNPFQDEIVEAKAFALPKCDYFKLEQGLPCASSDAGNGPLSVVERRKSSSSAVDAEPVRMSPVVDTEGYLPGRSPFQMQLARGGRQNSDITG